MYGCAQPILAGGIEGDMLIEALLKHPVSKLAEWGETSESTVRRWLMGQTPSTESIWALFHNGPLELQSTILADLIRGTPWQVEYLAFDDADLDVNGDNVVDAKDLLDNGGLRLAIGSRIHAQDFRRLEDNVLSPQEFSDRVADEARLSRRRQIGAAISKRIVSQGRRKCNGRHSVAAGEVNL